MAEVTHCPTCQTKLKGILLGYSLLPEKEVETINKILERTGGIYCTKCAPELVEKVRSTITEDRGNLKEEISKIIQSIPIATIQNPPKWEFEVKGVVTGQSTIGTGIIADIFSGLTDLVGAPEPLPSVLSRPVERGAQLRRLFERYGLSKSLNMERRNV